MAKMTAKTQTRIPKSKAIQIPNHKPALNVGIYPGTFDPITHGHLDIIRRAASLVDHLIVAISKNAEKEPLFPLAERIELVKEELGYKGNIEVVGFDNLLMHFASQRGAGIVVRGLRAVTDFEYEFQMTGMNHRLNPDIETVFLMASEKHQFISSRFVKEIRRLGGDISPFVPPRVAKALDAIFGSNHGSERVEGQS